MIDVKRYINRYKDAYDVPLISAVIRSNKAEIEQVALQRFLKRLQNGFVPMRKTNKHGVETIVYAHKLYAFWLTHRTWFTTEEIKEG